MKLTLIIPDIHGRTFWKEAIEKYKSQLLSREMHCIFLGDYLDPYPNDLDFDLDSSFKKTINNFKEIIEAKKTIGNSITLLLGNHDLHYIDEYEESGVYKCRYIWDYELQIKKIFKNNWKLFSVAYEDVLPSGKRCLFTHAGVVKPWVDLWFDNMAQSTDISAVWLNSFLLGNKSDIYKLATIGEDRGGRGYGSPVWADAENFYYGFMNEKHREECPEIRQIVYPDIYQVFGHTLYFYQANQNTDAPIADRWYVDENFAMLDARRAFLMTEDGAITPA